MIALQSILSGVGDSAGGYRNSGTLPRASRSSQQTGSGADRTSAPPSALLPVQEPCHRGSDVFVSASPNPPSSVWGVRAPILVVLQIGAGKRFPPPALWPGLLTRPLPLTAGLLGLPSPETFGHAGWPGPETGPQRPTAADGNYQKIFAHPVWGHLLLPGLKVSVLRRH